MRQTTDADPLRLYAVLRRRAWSSSLEMQKAMVRSIEVGGQEMADRVLWIRSYILEELDGVLGSICIYAANGPEAIRAHAKLAKLPVDEIVAVGGTLAIRPEPGPEREQHTALTGSSGSGTLPTRFCKNVQDR